MTSVEDPVPSEPCGRGKELREEELRLFERVVARDELALMECLDRVGQMVFCAALAQAGDQGAAEDLTEELFVRFWRSPEAFDPARGPLGLQMVGRLKERVGAAA